MKAICSVIYFPKQSKSARPHRKPAKSAKIIIRRLRTYRAGLPLPVPPLPKPRPRPITIPPYPDVPPRKERESAR